MTEPLTRLRVVVRGRVQGVGFRWFVVESAREHSLSGWVRNRPDGTVELEAEGPSAALARFVEELKRGPALARVDAVDASPLPPEGGDAFEVLG